ncbi:LuxR C-terminal-related transcriptional regulator [Fontimonas sp. SYSU GA230001]|uniref:helix-turn-helix transcriptional regulator n=1 Tax=Fontimonas sp. SYSU GA230001 TaxID=3142450 RepID=UPI0032B56B60
MAWIATAGDARWIGRLYRQTAQCEAAALRHWALDHLAASVPFDAAVWGTRRRDHERLTATTVHQLGTAALQPLLRLGVRHWVAPAGRGSDGDAAVVRQFDLAETSPRDADAAELATLGWSQLFVLLQPQPGTLFVTVLCLLRAKGGFSYEECERLRLLLPHLAEAETLALEQRLALDARLARAGRRNRGPACLVDASGAVRAMAPGFRELLRKQQPHWSGLTLPASLQAQARAHVDTGAAEFDALGLHARINAAEDDLYQLHVRPCHPFDRLTAREHDIVKAMVEGESYKLVARRLGVSASTVANHASNIYRKLGALNRDQVVSLAGSFRGESDDPRV